MFRAHQVLVTTQRQRHQHEQGQKQNDDCDYEYLHGVILTFTHFNHSSVTPRSTFIKREKRAEGSTLCDVLYKFHHFLTFLSIRWSRSLHTATSETRLYC